MWAKICISKNDKIKIEDDMIVISDEGGEWLHIKFDGLETIEALENNLAHIASGIRAEQTMKEGIENGNKI